MEAILSAAGGIAFYIAALFLHARTSNPKMKWVAAGLAFFGGLAVARSALDNQVFGPLADLHPVIPAIVAATVLAVAGIDLSDGRPDKPATTALFFVAPSFPYLVSGLASDNLTRALVLGLLAGIAAQRENDTHEQVIKWIAVGLGLAAGWAFSLTGIGQGLAGWLYPQLVGIVGFVAILTWFADLIDKKPGWQATAAGYVIPVSLPFVGLLVESVI